MFHTHIVGYRCPDGHETGGYYDNGPERPCHSNLGAAGWCKQPAARRSYTSAPDRCVGCSHTQPA